MLREKRFYEDTLRHARTNFDCNSTPRLCVSCSSTNCEVDEKRLCAKGFGLYADTSMSRIIVDVAATVSDLVDSSNQ